MIHKIVNSSYRTCNLVLQQKYKITSKSTAQNSEHLLNRLPFQNHECLLKASTNFPCLLFFPFFFKLILMALLLFLLYSFYRNFLYSFQIKLYLRTQAFFFLVSLGDYISQHSLEVTLGCTCLQVSSASLWKN